VLLTLITEKIWTQILYAPSHSNHNEHCIIILLEVSRLLEIDFMKLK